MGASPTTKESLYPVLCLTAIILGIVVLIFTLIFAFAIPAKARDYGQWDKADPEIVEWYRSLKQPETTVSCCGEADAYWCGTVKVVGGNTVCIIEDERVIPHRPDRHGQAFIVPPERIVKAPNPSGHVVIFIGYNDKVLCFVFSGGA